MHSSSDCVDHTQCWFYFVCLYFSGLSISNIDIFEFNYCGPHIRDSRRCQFYCLRCSNICIRCLYAERAKLACLHDLFSSLSKIIAKRSLYLVLNTAPIFNIRITTQQQQQHILNLVNICCSITLDSITLG